MQEILSLVATNIVSALVIVVGTLVSLVLHKGKEYLEELKKKDQLGIINVITDQVVEYAEAELKGQRGIHKRNFAVQRAKEILHSKGIHVTEEEILAGIENGLNKLKARNELLVQHPPKSDE